MADEQPGNPNSDKSLRERAEELLRTEPDVTPHLPTGDVQSLLHELQVYQAELEIQNQELRETQLQLAESRDRLSDLFEYAPVGYVTLDRRGHILEANLTASQMLNVPRTELTGTALSSFVEPELQDRLHRHLRSVFQHESTQSCEIEVRCAGDESKAVRLDTLVAGSHDDQQFRMSVVDITARKDAEAAQRESEQRFRSMADDLPLIVWQHDAEGKQEFVNQTFCEFFGVDQEELLENRWQQLLHPDDADAYRDEFFRCVRDRRPFHAEVRVKRADGEWRWLESWGRPRFTDNGDFLGILGTSADVTERKQAEEQVKAMNATLEQRVEERTAALAMLSEIASTANTTADVETAFVRILERVSQHNGWICGHAWVADPEDPDSLRPAYRWYDSKIPHHDELRERLGTARVRRGEGLVGRVFAIGEPDIMEDAESHLSAYQVEAAEQLNARGVAAFPILAGDTVVGVLEFFSERKIAHSEELLNALASVGTQLGRVVERLWAAQSLEEREERLRTILETAADAIVAVDRWGGIEHANPATERIFGYRENELIGNSISLLLASPDHERTSKLFSEEGRTADSDAAGTSVEAEGRRKDGSVFPLELSASQVDHSGMFTVILRDISQRKAEQQRLLQAERLAAIGEAMAGLTHESRNALARSQANLNRLERRLAAQPEMMELIEAIQAAQDDIAHQFEEVRAYAAPLVLERTPQDLRSVIEEAWSQLSPLRDGRDATLRFVAVAADLVCEIDELSMRDVFRNILENSLAACDDPVDIDIDFSENEADSEAALKILVRDNGPGFSVEACQRAFESFFTTKIEGTGLGLSIVKRIVEAHGGIVELGSEASQHAEIVITLPRKAE